MFNNQNLSHKGLGINKHVDHLKFTLHFNLSKRFNSICILSLDKAVQATVVQMIVRESIIFPLQTNNVSCHCCHSYHVLPPLVTRKHIHQYFYTTFTIAHNEIKKSQKLHKCVNGSFNSQHLIVYLFEYRFNYTVR